MPDSGPGFAAFLDSAKDMLLRSGSPEVVDRKLREMGDVCEKVRACVLPRDCLAEEAWGGVF